MKYCFVSRELRDILVNLVGGIVEFRSKAVIKNLDDTKLIEMCLDSGKESAEVQLNRFH
jgi:hypothetical protein